MAMFTIDAVIGLIFGWLCGATAVKFTAKRWRGSSGWLAVLVGTLVAVPVGVLLFRALTASGYQQLIASGIELGASTGWTISVVYAIAIASSVFIPALYLLNFTYLHR